MAEMWVCLVTPEGGHPRELDQPSCLQPPFTPTHFLSTGRLHFLRLSEVLLSWGLALPGDTRLWRESGSLFYLLPAFQDVPVQRGL